MAYRVHWRGSAGTQVVIGSLGQASIYCARISVIAAQFRALTGVIMLLHIGRITCAVAIEYTRIVDGAWIAIIAAAVAGQLDTKVVFTGSDKTATINVSHQHWADVGIHCFS